MSASQASDSRWTFPTRRMNFEDRLSNLPRYFAEDQNLIVCHLAAVLSASFPDGEDFFVRSVRHFRGVVTDPALQRQVAGFIGQETVHGREHRVLNQRLAELGYPMARLEWRTKLGIRMQERFFSPMACLAQTAAVEHVTATLAEFILGEEAVRRMWGPEVGDVMTWHALEEAEHKAVAFDVYRAAGGSEAERIRMMKLIRVAFIFGSATEVAISVLRDRAAYERGNLRRSWRQFRTSPAISRRFWQQIKEYDEPGFHPNDRDTSALVVEWREKLFGDEGSLAPHLAGVASATE